MTRNSILCTIIIIGGFTFSFCVGQVFGYFTQKPVIVDQSSVLGISTQVVLADNNTLQTRSYQFLKPIQTNAVDFISKSYHGYLFDRYLSAKRSPLAGHGDDFVEACEKYGAPEDCTLLIAISKVETNYCLTDISAKQHNCWGFGGAGPNRILYKNFTESIDEVTRRLMTGYGTGFFNDPRQGGLSYCGGHCVNWGKHVRSEQMALKSYLNANGL